MSALRAQQWVRIGLIFAATCAARSIFAAEPLLSLDPFADAAGRVLLLESEAKPPESPAESGAPSNLKYMPDQRELAEAPNRYTLFTGQIKEKSAYGKAWFPEPLSNAEMDLEFQEMQVRYQHNERTGHRFDEAKLEVEQAFGALTLEVEIPWQKEIVHQDEDEHNEGISRVELGMRYPLFQLVSEDGTLDYTCVGAMEVAIPTNLHFSKDTELSPRIYQLFRWGDHFSAQMNLGMEGLIGPDRGGTVTIIYGITLGWNISREELPIPGITQLIPIFEITGEHTASGDREGDFAGANFGTVGLRFNTESIFGIQPRIGIGYVFPLDDGARDEMHWGIITSVILEF
jgi:hypothetical protein